MIEINLNYVFGLYLGLELLFYRSLIIAGRLNCLRRKLVLLSDTFGWKKGIMIWSFELKDLLLVLIRVAQVNLQSRPSI